MGWTPLEPILFRYRHPGWTAAAFATIAMVGAVDYAADPAITFSVFYLIPVAAAAWLSGTGSAIAASGIAALTWLGAEYATSRLNSSLLVYAWNFGVRLLFLLLVALLLARLRDMLIRERGLSRTDLATGLPNARAFRETFEGEIARAQRYAQPLSLAFVDIDDFKRVNDSRGHVEGDRLLRRFGQAIRAQLRGSDTVARYGGDEFVILLTAADQNAARAAVDKLRRALSEEMTKESWAADFSIGVVTVQPGGPGASVDALLERADELMYEAKFSGKRGARFAIHGR